MKCSIKKFSEMYETSKALLCTEHPPARVRQIFGFVKALGYMVLALPAKCRIRESDLRLLSDGLYRLSM